MKKILFTFLAFSLLFSSSTKADEGMWLPMFIKRLNYVDMQKHGLQLTAEEIYSVNNSSMKDAIVSLGGFCTAEVISSKGLLLTNHHCGYDAIQSHSTKENNYLDDGFWAKSLDQELPNEGLFVRFLVRMEDVTNKIVGELTDDMTPADRAKKIGELSKTITDEAKGETHYEAQVKSFFEGNEFYLFVYEKFEDVRLVGAPPQSVGKFGGDTDNWMWPRHTGDFSLLRVYSDKDGMPAKFSNDNVPLSPKHSLPISLKGVKTGDFAMIMGYPGSTDRYLTSFGIENELQNHQPTVVEIRDLKLAIMDEFMEQDEKVRLQYSSKHAQVANYWKYFIGQQKQLKRNKVKAKKEALEKEFTNWVHANKKRVEKYGDALKMIEAGIDNEVKTTVSSTYLIEAGLTGAEAVLFAFRLNRMLEPGIADPNMLEAAKPKARKQIESTFKDFHFDLDKKLFAELLKLYSEKVPAEQLPDFFKDLVAKKYKNNFNKFADAAYDKSIFTDKERALAFLEKPSAKDLEKDLVLKVANSLIQIYYGMAGDESDAAKNLDKGKRLFVAGLREMQPNKSFYPDANSTMRLTYGTVRDYDGVDAVHYKHITTIDGIMEKEDPTNPEFVVPAKIKELYEKKDYGQYAMKDGNLPVCFLTDNDITGGNSGSPVINGKGELIGTAFDGNWEAMSGDISFEKTVQRTIVCDIRYVLFIIDKYAGATNLIEEMNLVTNNSPTSLKNMVDANKAKVLKAAN